MLAHRKIMQMEIEMEAVKKDFEATKDTSAKERINQLGERDCGCQRAE